MAGIGQRIDVDDPQLGVGSEGRADEVAADEAGTSGDQHDSRMVNELVHGENTGS